MALQTFTAGQVLTAAQVTALQANDYNQTVSTKVANYTLVAADKGTRVVGNGTSITFTVDNTIFAAGDTIKLHNINSTALTVAAGAGVTINAAAGLTMAQYQEATLFATSASSFILFESTAATTTQGLTLINTTSFSGVSSQSINDVFSASYENYLFVANIEGSNQGVNFTARLRVAGTDASGADYENQQLYATSSTVAGGRQNGTTNFFLGTNQNNNRNAFQLTLYEPFLARPTSYQSHFFRGEPTLLITYGAHTLSTSYTGITFAVDSNTMTGKVSVYGYNF